MKLCETCGNELEDSAIVCPFCDHAQPFSPTSSRNKGSGIATVNLKQGHPYVDEAMRTLNRTLNSHQPDGARLLRIIHGWGSSGKGGEIKSACLQTLKQQQELGRIRRFVQGENYSDQTVAGRALLSAYPKLKTSLYKDRNNPGITFVEC